MPLKLHSKSSFLFRLITKCKICFQKIQVFEHKKKHKDDESDEIQFFENNRHYNNHIHNDVDDDIVEKVLETRMSKYTKNGTKISNDNEEEIIVEERRPFLAAAKTWINIPVKHIQTTTPTAQPKIRQLPVTTRTMQLASFQQTNNNNNKNPNTSSTSSTSSNSGEAVFLSESTCVLESNAALTTDLNKSSSGTEMSSSSHNYKLDESSGGKRRGFLKTAHFKVLTQFQSDQENLIRQHYRHHYSKVHDQN